MLQFQNNVNGFEIVLTKSVPLKKMGEGSSKPIGMSLYLLYLLVLHIGKCACNIVGITKCKLAK
jgi:hypothetical protein